MLLVVAADLASCGRAGAPPPVAGSGPRWLELATDERAAELFDRGGTEPRFLRVPGGMLRFVELGPAGRPLGMGDAEPWLFVHGLGGSLGDFAPLVLSAAARHRVIALDLPGFGGSTSRTEDYTIEGFVRTLRQALGALRVARVHLVCHSLGGQVCLGLALDAPAGVASLTLIDSAGGYDPAQFITRATRGVLGQVFPDRDPVVQQIVGGDLAVLRRLLSSDPFVTAAISSFQRSYRGRLRDVSVPTLVIWGADDLLFPVDEGVFLKENIAGSTLRIAHGAGHAPQLSSPALVLEWIERFHAGLGPRSEP